MSNREQSLKPILLQLHEKFLKNSSLTIIWSFSIWSKLERWKSLISGCLMSWPPPPKKEMSFWSVVFSYPMQQQWTISQSDHDMGWQVDFIWQLATTSSVTGLRRSSKALPKPNFHQKPITVTVWLSTAFLSTTAFWILAKALPLRSMLNELLKCTEKCNSCSWSVPALVNRKGPVLHDNTWPQVAQQKLQKLNKLGYKFCLILCIHLTSHQPPLLPSILTAFYRENTFTAISRQKKLSKSSPNLEAQILMLQE